MPEDILKEYRARVGHFSKRFHGEEWHTPKGRAIREVVFGMNDGLITTIGFVMGLAASIKESNLVLLAGIMAMFAGAISMFFGAYISTKSQSEYFDRELRREAREIEEVPEKEIAEMQEIFAEKGFTKSEADILVKRVTSDKQHWLEFMAKEELGIVPETFDNPLKVGATMGISFLIGALPPLLPFAFTHRAPLAAKVAGIVSLVALFFIGAGRSKVTKLNWVRNGLEIMIIGILAGSAGLLFGHFSSLILK